MSTASAFSGETYTTCVVFSTLSPRSAARYSASIHTRNPARVLPEPVGAAIRVCSPALIWGQPPAWAGVGPSGNRRSNQARTAGWKPLRMSLPVPRTGAASITCTSG